MFNSFAFVQVAMFGTGYLQSAVSLKNCALIWNEKLVTIHPSINQIAQYGEIVAWLGNRIGDKQRTCCRHHWHGNFHRSFSVCYLFIFFVVLFFILLFLILELARLLHYYHLYCKLMLFQKNYKLNQKQRYDMPLIVSFCAIICALVIGYTALYVPVS